MLPALHQAFFNSAIERLQGDERILGVAMAGSYITGEVDEHSDLDFVLVVGDPNLTLSDERFVIAEGLGNLLQAFSGEHVGEPRLLIGLYGPPLLHVDLKFVTLEQLANRVDDPVVIFDRTDQMARVIAENPGVYPRPDPQWIEDRFWVWIHYCEAKLRRGEVMEACTGIGYLLEKVIVPLAMDRQGLRASGVRRLEQSGLPSMESIMALPVPHDAARIHQALIDLVRVYRELRPADVVTSRAEATVQSYLLRTDDGRES